MSKVEFCDIFSLMQGNSESQELLGIHSSFNDTLTTSVS